jgi:hypothetical protein
MGTGMELYYSTGMYQLPSLATAVEETASGTAAAGSDADAGAGDLA